MRKFKPRNSRCFWLLRASNKCSPQCIVLSCCCLLLSAIRLTLLSVFVLRIIRSFSGSSYFLYSTCKWEEWLSHVKHWSGNPQWHTLFLHDSVLIPLSNGTYHWLSHEWGLMYCLQNNELRILEQRWPSFSDTGLQGLRQSLTHNLTMCSSVFWVHFSKLLFFCTCSNLDEYCSTYICSWIQTQDIRSYTGFWFQQEAGTHVLLSLHPVLKRNKLVQGHETSAPACQLFSVTSLMAWFITAFVVVVVVLFFSLFFQVPGVMYCAVLSNSLLLSGCSTAAVLVTVVPGTLSSRVLSWTW